jgi:predicted glycosyltransferase
MKILINIGHLAQFNFYKNAIIELAKNHQVFVTYLKRGKLPVIIENEFCDIQNVEKKAIGRHRGNKISILVEANFVAIFKAAMLIFKFKPDVVIGNNYIASVGANFFHIPTCTFNDDPERGKISLRLLSLLSNILYLPFYPEKKNIKSMNALKEWAYLSPKYFHPNINVLDVYKLKPKEYLFAREVSTGTFNYAGQEQGLIESLSQAFPKNFPIVLSLEDKKLKHLYPKNWIILEEPVTNIHSLIFYSKVLVSSGDSMAREAAQLGVPSIYCGFRAMHANNILINKGILFHKQKQEVLLVLDNILNDDPIIDQDKFREALFHDWDDLTQLIITEALKNYKK